VFDGFFLYLASECILSTNYIIIIVIINVLLFLVCIFLMFLYCPLLALRQLRHKINNQELNYYISYYTEIMSNCQSNPFMTNHENSNLQGVYRHQNVH
jgi:ABC-type bacteriocin/lantibiotic exporter with double-glycine peptidase domain